MYKIKIKNPMTLLLISLKFRNKKTTLKQKLVNKCPVTRYARLKVPKRVICLQAWVKDLEDGHQAISVSHLKLKIVAKLFQKGRS